jgi:PAS domain S-box-containing protein
LEDVRILLVSDDAEFRVTAAAWINHEPGLRLVGTTHDRREAISLTVKARPEVVFVDASLLLPRGYDVAGAIAALAPRVRLIAVTGSDADVATTRTHHCAFDGLISKPDFAAVSPPLLRALFPSWQPARTEVLLGERDVLQRLLATSTSLAFGVGVDGRTLFVNRAAERLTGWTEAELAGRNWWQTLFPGETYRQVEELFRDHPLGPVTGHEMTLVTRAGEHRPMTWNLVPRRGAAGELVELVGVATDLTERRRVEGALQRLAQGISSLTGDAWFQSFVRNMAETLGVSLAFVCRLMPGRTRGRTLAMWSDGAIAEPFEYDLAETPCSDVLREGTSWFPSGVRERFPNDPVLAAMRAESYMGAALVDRRGEVVGIIGVAHDEPLVDVEPALATFRIYAERAIAEMERRTAQDEVEAREQRFRALVEYGQDIITSVDADYRLTYVSGAAERVLGQDAVLHLGESLFTFVHPDDHADVRLCLSRLQEGTRSGALTVRVRHRDGHWCPLEAICSAFRAPDGSLVRVLNARDVSDRLRLEAQLVQAQRLESVGRLAAGLAHDFNNLLQAILGFASSASRQLGPEHSLQREMGEIQSAGSRAAVLTRQLLAFSRRQVMSPQAFDLNAVVENMSGLIGGAAGDGITVTYALSPEAGPAFADSTQIEQVLLNLVVNARDAMPAGGQLRIGTSNTRLDEAHAQRLGVRPGEYVTLSVSDDGVGMDAETLGRVFEPFFTTKDPSRGTGLGLSTVYGIARQSEGAVEAESAPGRGTTFRVHLRRSDERPAHPPEAAPLAAHATTPVVTGVTVLVVDDEGAIRLLVERTLAMAGYRVLTAEAPEAALSLVERHDGDIHVVVSDIVMPGMAVELFFEELRRQRPSIATLLMSGYPDEAIGWVQRSAGSHLFLAKPFHPMRLLESVQSLLAPRPAASGSPASRN